MSKQISNFKKTIALAVLGSILSIVFLFLILPFLTTSLFDVISVIDLVSASTIVGYLGIMINFSMMLLVFILFDRVDYKLKLDSFVYASIYSILFLAIGSLVYVIFYYPDILTGVTKLNIFLHLFVYPSVISINLGSSQLIWIISIVIFVILFNLRYYSLNHVPKVEIIKGEKPSAFSKAFLWIMIILVIIIGFLIIDYNENLFYLYLINIGMVLIETAIFHFLIGYFLKKIIKNKRESETILEHAIFYSIADISYIALRNSVFSELTLESWLLYDSLTIILAILIFYHVSAINYLVSGKFGLSVDIFGEVLAIAITFLLEYLQVITIIIWLIVILSVSMIIIITEQKVY